MDLEMGEILPEGEGYFNLDNEGEKIPCHPDTTAAFVHHPFYKDVDHIFVETSPDEGIFLFRKVFGVIFNPLVRDMEKEGFHVQHSDTPSDMDWVQFVNFSTRDINKYWEVLDGTD